MLESVRPSPYSTVEQERAWSLRHHLIVRWSKSAPGLCVINKLRETSLGGLERLPIDLFRPIDIVRQIDLVRPLLLHGSLSFLVDELSLLFCLLFLASVRFSQMSRFFSRGSLAHSRSLQIDEVASSFVSRRAVQDNCAGALYLLWFCSGAATSSLMSSARFAHQRR